MINIVSGYTEFEKMNRWNQVCAYFLNRALGDKSTLIHNSQELPEGEHALVLSNSFYQRLKNPAFYKKVKSRVKALSLFVDSDIRGDREKIFDKIFTGNPLKQNALGHYHWIGYGVDTKHSYPCQTENKIFVDSYTHSKEKMKRYYKIIDEVKKGLCFTQPTKDYTAGRMTWIEMQENLRKCTFFVSTHYQRSGLGLLEYEAVACGARLVIAKEAYYEDVMRHLPHEIWETEEELYNIFSNPRKEYITEGVEKARWFNWDNVAKRLLCHLEK